MSEESFDTSSRKMFDATKEVNNKTDNNNRLHFWSNSVNSVSLVLLSILEAIIVIALEAVIFVNFHNTEFSKHNLGLGIPVYLMIFITSQVFQVFTAWDAVRAQNTIQVIAFLLFNLCCFVYAVFQFKQMADALRSNDPYLGELANWLKSFIYRLLIAVAVITGVCQLAYFYLGIRLYQEFGWKIYKRIGADPEIRNMYRWYQIFLTILKLDFFFFLGYSIQYLILVLRNNDPEFPLTIVALPVTCLVLLLAVYAVRHESKWLISLFFLGLFAGVAYFSFKLYRIYDVSQAEKYKFVKDFLTFFASVSLAFVILTLVNAIICFLNFDKGLKPHLTSRYHQSSTPENLNERTLSLD
ncbi:uncharacterized protein RHIMIDRAFT_270897 [Rhizopus microsporus ATCC 52813]|uniref:Uncharacterized protein n=1 Tax=Rhizopus microsporus ATCC 52813 TaxID=1340429 RepID=A0A2G4SGU1_RHIZD|nr:uncharacterized protein RHIMIDRAFT_270897 [Rhizopus microsporus ATCC 52813]PHZ07987.1 hypothetical protein RHIMIDRAFT_270897 [Rhizopus microsporus ATCC 52813]